jgi:phosphopantetheinyl transferase (holo-ACP synthase)
LHKENGKPYLKFSGKALEIVRESGLSFDVSITHTESIATAIVIAFQGERL